MASLAGPDGEAPRGDGGREEDGLALVSAEMGDRGRKEPRGKRDAEAIVAGQSEAFERVHVLRSAPCSGDAWAGIFFDVQAKDAADVEILGIATASHIFRKDPAVTVNLFVCNGSGVDKEGDLLSWEHIYHAPNISLPTVGKREPADRYNETMSAYGFFQLDAPLPLAAGSTLGFAIYTNSLCGLALRSFSSVCVCVQAFGLGVWVLGYSVCDQREVLVPCSTPAHTNTQTHT